MAIYNLVYKNFIEGWSYDVAKYEFSKVAKYFTEPIDAVISCNTPYCSGCCRCIKG